MYSELVRLCSEHCSDEDQALNVAKMFDDSASVIIIGDVVFLRPEQVNFLSSFFIFLFSVLNFN
uniref:Uncharacterized protein n=1 Tax=Cajanus cajan TaxID=3821 RepID=A0A151UDW8_CAJCA